MSILGLLRSDSLSCFQKPKCFRRQNEDLQRNVSIFSNADLAALDESEEDDCIESNDNSSSRISSSCVTFVILGR